MSKRIRFTLGERELRKFEKKCKAVFKVKGQEYEVVLSDSIELSLIGPEEIAAMHATKDRKKMD